MRQQGDVELFQTDNGGEITVFNGIVEMSGGLGTAAYLSLFGGNEDDDGRGLNVNNWWGNLSEDIPAREYRSETQSLLKSLSITTANLRRIEDAARRDLAWFVTTGETTSVSVTASIPAVNRLKLEIMIDVAATAPYYAEILENWGGSE